jgi:DNA polymerase III epsilon subunit-like protein
MVKILVFDTETTDVGPIGSAPGLSYTEKKVIENALVGKDVELAKTYWDQWAPLWPYITQLGYIVYDTENPESAKIFDKYIDIPDNVQISSGSSEITRIFKSDKDIIEKNITDKETGKLITPDTLNIFILDRIKTADPGKVIDISTALREFTEDLKMCDYVVGHNIDFDIKMILAELKRLKMDSEFVEFLSSDNFVCTMMKMINVCKVTALTKFGKKYFKFPKLKEAYKTLFGYEPSGPALHNAIIDVVVCLRVFCKLGDPVDIDVCGTNDKIAVFINSISPPEFQCPIAKITTTGGKKKKPNKKLSVKKGGKKRRSKRLNKRRKTCYKKFY